MKIERKLKQAYDIMEEQRGVIIMLRGKLMLAIEEIELQKKINKMLLSKRKQENT